ncbi:MAG: hypothetical protein AB7J37_04040 [Candidatus Melainabacteria bacterium]
MMNINAHTAQTFFGVRGPRRGGEGWQIDINGQPHSVKIKNITSEEVRFELTPPSDGNNSLSLKPGKGNDVLGLWGIPEIGLGVNKILEPFNPGYPRRAIIIFDAPRKFEINRIGS